MSEPWLVIIGLGEDGPEGLTDASRADLARARLVFGGARHLALAGIAAERARPWPVPFDLAPLLAERGRGPVAMLVSGDPFWFGAGGSVAAHLAPGEWRAHPAPGCFALIAARLGWRLEDTACLGLHAAPFARLRPVLARGVRAICTLRDGAAVGALAGWLCDQGLGATRIWVAEAIGGPRARLRDIRADQWRDAPEWADLAVPVPVAVALDGADLPRGAGLSRAAGRPDDSFAHDGQITRAPVRAVTLAALAPRAGALLWDIGGGSGAVSVEWCLAGGRAITIEPRADRLANISANIAGFGLAGQMRALHGAAPEALAELPAPDAVFLGGGGSDAVLEAIWPRLPQGARLVANAVTLETEALLQAAQARHGGSLLRLDLAEARPLGRMRGWQPARPVVQWAVTR